MHEQSISFQALILAAGRGVRAGGPKALRAWQGATWIEWVCAEWLRLGACGVTVTWNSEFAVPRALGSERVLVVMNEEVEAGPFRSLQLGLAAAPGLLTAVSPVDVPPPGDATMGMLLEASGGKRAAKPMYRGRGGHPVMLPPAMIADLLARDARTNRLDEILHASDVVLVDVDDARVTMNLNDDESWREWTAYVVPPLGGKPA